MAGVVGGGPGGPMAARAMIPAVELLASYLFRLLNCVSSVIGGCWLQSSAARPRPARLATQTRTAMATSTFPLLDLIPSKLLSV